MRLELYFAALFATSLIPFSKGEAQISRSPGASLVPAMSPIASPTGSPVTSPTAASTKLFYKPPAASGNLPARVSGGARGEAIDAVLIALVPNHVALPTQS